jgi:ribosomal protein S18 acetylase RimI-like enzyme
MRPPQKIPLATPALAPGSTNSIGGYGHEDSYRLEAGRSGPIRPRAVRWFRPTSPRFPQPAMTGGPRDPAVRRLVIAEARLATDVLVEAFHDYPVMHHVLGSVTDDYESRLERLVEYFVACRILRGEPVLGIDAGGRLIAAALVSDPLAPSPPEVAEAREALWAELGSEARSRYEVFGAAVGPLLPGRPRLHLNMIGVRGAARGRGLARVLLDHVHLLASGTKGCQGVSLTTEDAANLPLYRRIGYVETGRARVAPDLETWAMFRRTGGSRT